MRHGMFFVIISGLLFGSMFLLTTVGEADELKAVKNDVPGLVLPRVPTQDNFPCSKCHNYRPRDRTERVLKEYHSSIKLKHAEGQRWCYDCHDGEKLRLQNGSRVGFDKSYYLCGQCHGTIFRDWKAGIHGKRSGLWDGVKLYRACVNCHDPHQPKFKAIEPKQPPMKPAEITKKD